MTDAREELERRLLRQPTDAAAREQYAGLLVDAEEWEAALIQYDLVSGMAPSARVNLGAARCLQALGRHEEARQRNDAARRLPDYAPELGSALAEESAAPRLQLISGGREQKVVALASRADHKVRFTDVAGMEALKKTIRLTIIEPFLRPSLFARFRKSGGGGILLYGPPGCGKTLIAKAVAGECGAQFIPVGISDILSMWVGGSEHNLAEVFREARASRPAVLFFDELDALGYSRAKARSEHTRTLVNEMLAQLDGMAGDNQDILVLAATNMPWDVDTALKRTGRFARQIFVPPPDGEARRAILDMRLEGLPCGRLDLPAVAKLCQGLSGADLDGVVELAKEAVIADILDGQERLIEQDDLLTSAESAVPSTREWFATARNLVVYGGAGEEYRDLHRYLKDSGQI